MAKYKAKWGGYQCIDILENMGGRNKQQAKELRRLAEAASNDRTRNLILEQVLSSMEDEIDVAELLRMAKEK